MRVSQRIFWLFSIGLLLCPASYAEHKVAPSVAEKAGREWAKQWLGNLRKRFAKPHEPVIHRANTGGGSFKPRMDFTFLNTPPVTGPLSFALALGSGFHHSSNAEDFYRWLHSYRVTPAQREIQKEQKRRYEKIIAELEHYYGSRGYSPKQAGDLARNLFESKIHIYRPLVENGAPNLASLTAGQSRNPYGRDSVANSATDFYNLGLMCQKVGNHEKAAEMYKRAIRTGHAMAQASLAYLYETGLGVPRDLNKAVEYYLLATKQGHAVAQYNLGRIYQNGLIHGLQVIQPDTQKAELFLQRAAAQGIVAAYHQLGVLYYTLGMEIQHNPRLLKPEEFDQWDKNKDKQISSNENRLLQDAHDHFLLAAKQNHGPAQHALGVMYSQGQGVTPNLAMSAHWLEKAVTHKLPDSIYNLAQIYENGIGVRLNLPRAFTLYRQAARLGHAPSQYNLGLFYYQGRNAGSQLSVLVTKDFHDKHPAKTFPDELVELNPEENAILADAVALYHPIPGSTKDWTLELLVPAGQERFTKAVLTEFARKNSLEPLNEPTIEQLGGNDPTHAYKWWKLAADRHQQAAIAGLELLKSILTPDQMKTAVNQAATLKSSIIAPKAPNPMVEAQAKIPFQSVDWSTGFFVSEDGYVITGKHLIHSGKRFQVVTENGTFPARAINMPGDLDQFLLLKVDGNYKFPVLSFSASHSTRQRDEVHVLGYQLPQNIQATQPRAAQATTWIHSVLGAQADPRFFTLHQPVLGDQLLFSFKQYLDDRGSSVSTMADGESFNLEDLRELQEETLKRLKGALRTHHVLLGNAHVSLGYQLEKPLWYDVVDQIWLKENKTQPRALLYPKGSWVELDGRKIRHVPPLDQVQNGQALIRISVVPGMVQREGQNLPTDVQAALRVAANKRNTKQWQIIRKHYLRLHQLAEEILTKDNPKTTLEKIIAKAQFKEVSMTPGFRGTALLNRQGQAIGLFFLSFRGRTPDVFQNFSSYHRYLLKSDHLMAFLNRLPDVNYTTRLPELPKIAANGGVPFDLNTYLLAKAKASMVLVQVAGELPTTPPRTNGGNKP